MTARPVTSPAQREMADEWIAWLGGKRPVDPDTVIQPHFRMWTREQAEQADVTRAGAWHWSHANRRSDIIAYRVVQP